MKSRSCLPPPIRRAPAAGPGWEHLPAPRRWVAGPRQVAAGGVRWRGGRGAPRMRGRPSPHGIPARSGGCGRAGGAPTWASERGRLQGCRARAGGGGGHPTALCRAPRGSRGPAPPLPPRLPANVVPSPRAATSVSGRGVARRGNREPRSAAVLHPSRSQPTSLRASQPTSNLGTAGSPPSIPQHTQERGGGRSAPPPPRAHTLHTASRRRRLCKVALPLAPARRPAAPPGPAARPRRDVPLQAAPALPLRRKPRPAPARRALLRTAAPAAHARPRARGHGRAPARARASTRAAAVHIRVQRPRGPGRAQEPPPSTHVCAIRVHTEQHVHGHGWAHARRPCPCV